MDWSKLSKIIVYPIPSYLTVRVGSIVAEFLENIVNLGLINSSDIHLIGHSLGSHVFGATGAAFSLGKIGRITGKCTLLKFLMSIKQYKIYRPGPSWSWIRKFKMGYSIVERFKCTVCGRDSHSGWGFRLCSTYRTC